MRWRDGHEAFIEKLVAIAGACLIVAFCAPHPSRAAEVEPMIKLTHGSDLARGCPFRCNVAEPQYDALTGGVTVTAGKRKRWEIDMSHGYKSIERGPSESATEFSVRYYPLRNRSNK